MYFGGTKNVAYGKINERSFSNPHAWARNKRIVTDDCHFIMYPIQSALVAADTAERR